MARHVLVPRLAHRWSVGYRLGPVQDHCGVPARLLGGEQLHRAVHRLFDGREQIGVGGDGAALDPGVPLVELEKTSERGDALQPIPPRLEDLAADELRSRDLHHTAAGAVLELEPEHAIGLGGRERTERTDRTELGEIHLEAPQLAGRARDGSLGSERGSDALAEGGEAMAEETIRRPRVVGGIASGEHLGGTERQQTSPTEPRVGHEASAKSLYAIDRLLDQHHLGIERAHELHAAARLAHQSHLGAQLPKRAGQRVGHREVVIYDQKPRSIEVLGGLFSSLAWRNEHAGHTHACGGDSLTWFADMSTKRIGDGAITRKSRTSRGFGGSRSKAVGTAAFHRSATQSPRQIPSSITGRGSVPR